MNTLPYSERPCDCLYPECADLLHCALPAIICLLENLPAEKLASTYPNGGPMTASSCNYPYPYCAELPNCAQPALEQGVIFGKGKSVNPKDGRGAHMALPSDEVDFLEGVFPWNGKHPPVREVAPSSVSTKDGTGAHTTLPSGEHDFLEDALPWNGK